MNIFGKHIFRSIKKEPFQPIMIVVIVTLCVAVMILSVSLPLNIYRNEHASLKVDDWTPDLIVRMKATSNERLMFEDEMNEALGDKGSAIGEFSLTGFSELTDKKGKTEKRQVFLGAFDLVKADSFFDIRYLEYGKFTNNNIDLSAIVDEPFAKEYGISLGDTVRINVLGYEFEYTVEAIAKETGVFNRQDILVDISSVRRVLAERSALIASLSSEFTPYTQMHVKTREGIDPADLKADYRGIFEHR